MIRLILFLIPFFMMACILCAIVLDKRQIQKSGDGSVQVQLSGDYEGKSSEDWWYSVPHYAISKSGIQFNIAEYITWDDWNEMSKSQRYNAIIEIGNMLSNDKEQIDNII